MDTTKCPNCGHPKDLSAPECIKCGIIFAKYHTPEDRMNRVQEKMRCDDISYRIIGDDMQIVEIELDPGETVIAEAGAMNYMGNGISFEAKMGDGSQPDQGVLGKLMSRRIGLEFAKSACRKPIWQQPASMVLLLTR